MKYSILIIVFFCILIPWLWYRFMRPVIKKTGLYRSLENHPDRKNLKKIEKFLMKLYQDVNGPNISLEERKRLMKEEDDYIYGEIDFVSFFIFLNKIKPEPGEVFYDLGSGVGKAVFATALCFDLSKVCGIELLPALFEKANEQVVRAKHLLQFENKAFSEKSLNRISHIQFINDNFLHCDINDANIIFINATCLHYQTMVPLIEKLTHLKVGTRIIVGTKKIENEKFQLLYQGLSFMSWGMSSVNIYIKTK